MWANVEVSGAQPILRALIAPLKGSLAGAVGAGPSGKYPRGSIDAVTGISMRWEGEFRKHNQL